MQFTWRYSGGASEIESITWGLKQDAIKDIHPNGELVSLKTKSGQGEVPNNLPERYIGRVHWSFSGDKFSGEVNFTLTSLENDDDRFYGCILDPVNPFTNPVFDYVYLVVQGELPLYINL